MCNVVAVILLRKCKFGPFPPFLAFSVLGDYISSCHHGIEGMCIEGATLPQQMYMRLPVRPAGHRFG
jgi:hypothetical protein